MLNSPRFSFSLLAAALLFPSLLIAGKPVKQGIFQGSADIGKTQPGSTVYDAATGTYRVTGGGGDMWGAADQFHFSWVRVSGDASLTADIHFPKGTAIPNEKAVLIFRQSLDESSPYSDVAIHGDGHITSQYRTTFNGKTEDTTSSQHNSTRLRIVRQGDQFTAYASAADGTIGTMTALPVSVVNLHDPIYVGIGVCSHNPDGVLTVSFSNVKLEPAGAKLGSQ